MSVLGKVREFLGFTDPIDVVDPGFIEDLGSDDDYKVLYKQEQSHSGEYSSASEPVASRRQPVPAVSMPSGATNNLTNRIRPNRSGRERIMPANMGSNVIGLPVPQPGAGEVIVLEPRSFDEMAAVLKHLRDRKSVVMNLTLMDPADAQRSVDFVAGGTYAIDGHQERIGENIFLFTPNCVSVIASGAPQAPQEVSPEAPAVPQAPTPIWAANGFEELAAVNHR